MSDKPVDLRPPPLGYAEWLAELQTSLPSIEQIERELGGVDNSGNPAAADEES